MMTNKISLTVELCIGLITFMSTLLWSDFFIELFTGVSTYALARVFWFLFGSKILFFIDKVKNKIKQIGFLNGDNNNGTK